MGFQPFRALRRAPPVRRHRSVRVEDSLPPPGVGIPSIGNRRSGMRSAELVAPGRPVGTGAAQWGHYSKVVNHAVTGVDTTVGVGVGVVHLTISSASAPAAAVPSYDGAAPVAAPVLIPVETPAAEAAP